MKIFGIDLTGRRGVQTRKRKRQRVLTPVGVSVSVGSFL